MAALRDHLLFIRWRTIYIVSLLSQCKKPKPLPTCTFMTYVLSYRSETPACLGSRGFGEPPFPERVTMDPEIGFLIEANTGV